MDGQALDGRSALESLASEEFDFKIAPMNSAAYVRTSIRRTPEYQAAKRALDAGLLTESLVRNFVTRLMRDFVPGQRFQHETALAALAVLCESHFARFAEELLFDLAALKSPEVAHATRVARECLQNRVRLPKTKAKKFLVAQTSVYSIVQMSQAAQMWKLTQPIAAMLYAID